MSEKKRWIYKGCKNLKLNKDGQSQGQKKKTEIDPQNIMQKTKDSATQTQKKLDMELPCLGFFSASL